MRVALLGGISLLMAVSAAADDWWDASWSYRQRVYIDASILKEDLEAFPLRVFLNGPKAPGDRMQRDGSDLRVVDPQGQRMVFQIVWTEQSETVLDILVPRLRANTPGQYIDIYYGNADADPGAAPTASAAPLWDQHYRSVLSRPFGLGAGAPVPEAVAAAEAAGFKFSPDGTYLTLDPKKLEGLGDQITLTVRFMCQVAPELQTFVSGKSDDGKDWINFGLKLPSTLHTNVTSGGVAEPELNVEGIQPETSHSVVARYDARNRTRTLCVDGAVLQQDSAQTGPLRITELRVGRGLLHFEPWQFKGVLGDVRVAATARSDSWMLAEAASLASSGLFYAVGAPQHVGEAVPPPDVPVLLDPQPGLTWRKRTSVTLRWKPAAGAHSYRVILYADPAATEPYAELDAGAQTRFELSAETAKQPSFAWSVLAIGEKAVAGPGEKRPLTFYDWSQSVTNMPETKTAPRLRTAKDARIDLEGYLRSRIDKIIDRWFLEVPESSPAILQVFRDRDKRPVREPLMPWAGEFAGKFLTAAELNWRLTHDDRLKAMIDTFVRDLIACQAPDGYLGPFAAETRLTGANWDVWGHYHCMLGLLLYHEDTGYEPALDACRKMGDLLYETFGPGGPSLTCDGSQGQMNMAVCHSLLLLYAKTGVPRYRELADYIVNDAWNEPNAGQYLKAALEGKEVWEFPAHRWEALHDYQALPLLYYLTGNDDYARAYSHIWESCAKGDRHNTGGFTSGEGCVGSPYNLGAIETCCTVAYTALSVDQLRLTGDTRAVDEIEWSTLNSALAAIPYSGRVCAYNVPMDGTRTFGVELPWQSPKAGPDLNCCSVNAARPLGMISEWALMESDPGVLHLNFYGPGTYSATLPSGKRVTLKQETDYPKSGRVRIVVTPEQPEAFTLALRIPSWSRTTRVTTHGVESVAAAPGAYHVIARTWNPGDTVELELDFGLRFWAGEQEVADKVSVYRGPILFAYDARFNDLNPDQLVPIVPADIKLTDDAPQGPIEPWLPATLQAGDVQYKVCDLASAGQTGNHYRTWLPATNMPPSPFHLEKPTREGDQVTLHWTARAGAERYTVYVWPADKAGGNVIPPDAQRVENLAEPNTTLTLDPTVPYRWTAIAINPHGETQAANAPQPLN